MTHPDAPDPPSVAPLFDALAEDYERMREEVGWSPWPHVEAAFGGLELQGWRALDVGSGTGEVAAHLVERGAEVVGVDISPRMCEIAAARVPNTPFMPLDVARGLPFDDDHVDATLALGCLEYVPDPLAVCVELARVTRPGGVLLVVLERCGARCPGGHARTHRLFDRWLRHRVTHDEVMAFCEAHLREARVDAVDGFRLEDSDQMTRYWRVIGRLA